MPAAVPALIIMHAYDRRRNRMVETVCPASGCCHRRPGHHLHHHHHHLIEATAPLRLSHRQRAGQLHVTLQTTSLRVVVRALA